MHTLEEMRCSLLLLLHCFAHSNCHTEVLKSVVKKVKRLITNNSGPDGELDTDSFQHAMLQYYNIHNKDTKLSLAMCMSGRFLAHLKGKKKEEMKQTSIHGQLKRE